MKHLLHIVRLRLDRYLQAAIRLAMATGVCFTVTACYGTPPEDWEGFYPTLPGDTVPGAVDTSLLRQPDTTLSSHRMQQRIEQLGAESLAPESERHKGAD